MENAIMSWQSLPIVSLFNQCSSVALNIPVVCIYAWEKEAQAQNTTSHSVCLSPRMMTGKFSLVFFKLNAP